VVLREQAAMCRAAAAGLPAPTPVLTVDDRPILAEGSVLWSLAPWMPGQSVPPASITEDQAELLGATLGRVHKALRVLDAARFPTLYQHTGVEPAVTLEQIATFRRLIDLQTEETAFDQIARDYLDFVEPRIRNGSPALAYCRKAPVQVLHGDFWYPNVLFADGVVTGILDWEFACAAPRSWELSYVFGCYCLLCGDVPRAVDLMCAFIKGYVREQPLTAVEAALIPELYRWFRLSSLRALYNHYVVQDCRTDVFVAPNIASYQMIEQLTPEVGERLARSSERTPSRRVSS
jgi:homoserine kinase type II